MVRPPSIDSNGMKKGAWSEDEDNKLKAYIQRYGHWNWRLLPRYAGLKRCGKSCRLRWVNYLKPGVKRGNFSKEEQEIVVKLHRQLGNKWSAIAEKLPGRTDNEIKNFWHTRIEKRRKPAHKAAKPTITTDSSETTSLSTSNQQQNLSPLFDASLSTNSSQDELDLMLSRMLATDAEFDYPELRYSELSCSGSPYMDSWTVEDDAVGHGSFWNDLDQSSNSESETSSYTTPVAAASAELGYDPLLEYLGYETSLLW